MSTEWMSLAVGMLTSATTLAAVLLTQWQSGRREAARAKVEAARESLAHAREDAARVLDHRREHYIAFLSMTESHLASWREFLERTGGQELAPERALDTLANQLLRVKIYGTIATADTAQRVYQRLRRELFDDCIGDDHATNLDGLIGEFVERIRRDLGVTDDLIRGAAATVS